MSDIPKSISSPSGATRQQQVIVLVGVTVMAIVAVLVIALINRPRDLTATLPTIPPTQVAAAPSVVPTELDPTSSAAGGDDPGTPVAAADDPTADETAASGTNPSVFVVPESGIYAGITRGLSETGMPQLGDPDAPILLEDYSSFGCGHCTNFHDVQFMALLEDMREGQLRFVFVPITNQFSLPASAAAFCALEQGRFWEMHDLLFGWLRQYGGSAYTFDRIMLGASALGLDLTAYEACLRGEDVINRINEANELFFTLAEQYQGEVTGTPTLVINGVPPELAPGYRSGSPSLEMLRAAIEAAQ